MIFAFLGNTIELTRPMTLKVDHTINSNVGLHIGYQNKHIFFI